MTAARGATVVRARSSRLALLLAAVVGVTLLPAVPAFADHPVATVIGTPSCQTNNGLRTCSRRGESWQTNSSTPSTFGSTGAYQSTYTYYSPSCCNDYPTQIQGVSNVWDQRTGSGYRRMRLTQTFKALGSGGGSISIAWGLFDWNPSDPSQVTATQVYLSMTRQAPIANNLMQSRTNLQFPHNNSVAKIEHASSSTIEYASSNAYRRLLVQIPQTDF
ncbi:hypothetical protein MRQ36_28715 [Micromonospora sp. R77]|uniref:hypothetical protein n=1 Tax=Micromonospora sp. R77 TaxID=2925836 RepID=UPI001F60D706|nr:hypothetical protein [Micromonospora sp. R77]MCI4066320.1 hypothetical protein [Micromonospora sp. R77]